MPLRVVVAPDGFGATLTAAQAAAAIARGWTSARPRDEVLVVPQSDGGPGFLDCLADGGDMRTTTVHSPLGAEVAARWLVAGPVAYLECAQACGLHLVPEPTPETALAADSRGLGELMAAALREPGVERIVIGLGGSVTTDGGRGLLDALGGPAAAAEAVRDVALVAATDVDNPLLGPRGAAAVFAPQKGADAAAVALLEARLAEYGELLDGLAGRVVVDDPGAGAAGGIGAALLALGAGRASGADLVAGATGLPAALTGADVVITGEGRLDGQTARGKVVARVADAARRAGSGSVIAIVGECALDDPAVLGLDAVSSLVSRAGRTRALTEAGDVVAEVAAEVAARWRAPRE
ncbi:MAG: glycerate kinase [Gordonia sp. (in: high G+C Gram-positive bacteria)]|uniref:glycerate kinase family protein n=1 Tax=Gordonia sp. (in: high G+C Gram-positive bacteria) TaxID=84139 RepID=UPI0039E6E6EE